MNNKIFFISLNLFLVVLLFNGCVKRRYNSDGGYYSGNSNQNNRYNSGSTPQYKQNSNGKIKSTK